MQKIQQVNLQESDIQENMEIRVQRADMKAKKNYGGGMLKVGIMVES